MHYLLFPYTVGCIYEGSSTDYLRFTTKDIDDFLIRLYDAMDAHVKDLNNALLLELKNMSFEDEIFLLSDFFYYDETDGKWSYYEPSYFELPQSDGLETFIVEVTIGDGCSYSLPSYHFVFASSKDEVVKELHEAYRNMINDKEKKSIEIGNVDFTQDDLIFYEEVSVSQYKKEYKGIYNTPDVYTVNEFFYIQ